MAKPRVLVLIGYGINCDRETEYAFERAGAEPKRVHINDLIEGRERLSDYQILAFPGGFSFGDDLGSGVVLAKKAKTNLSDDVLRFIDDEKLIIGICNGFQVMIKFGLLADSEGDYKTQRATVTYNDSGRFEDRWVHLKGVNDKCAWTKGVDEIYLPVAHGEGKFYTTEERLDALQENGQVCYLYADDSYQPAGLSYPQNPNGSLRDIAGICDPTGRVFGMMPHPERFLHFTNHPRWTRIKEVLRREGKHIPEDGDGIEIFKNGVRYFE